MVRRRLVHGQVAGPVADLAGAGAPGLEQFAVHVDQREAGGGRGGGMGAVVQVVDVLGDQQEVARPAGGEVGESVVGGVGMHRRQPAAATVVEVLHQGGVAGEGLGRRHVLKPTAHPQAVVGAEGGHAGLGGYAGAGEDDEVFARHAVP